MTPEPVPVPDDLDAYLAGDEPDWETEPEAPPDAEHADRMLHRLAGVRAALRRDHAVAVQRMASVEEWLQGRRAVHQVQEEWLLGALRRYHEAVLSLRPAAKTINLPAGDLVSRAGSREWTMDDEAVTAWLLPEPVVEFLAAARADYREAVDRIITELVGAQRVPALKFTWPVPPAVSRSGLKTIGTRRDEKGKPVAWGVTEDGETIPGVTVEVGERTFDVRLRSETDEREEAPSVEAVPDQAEEWVDRQQARSFDAHLEDDQ